MQPANLYNTRCLPEYDGASVILMAAFQSLVNGVSVTVRMRFRGCLASVTSSRHRPSSASCARSNLVLNEQIPCTALQNSISLILTTPAELLSHNIDSLYKK